MVGFEESYTVHKYVVICKFLGFTRWVATLINNFIRFLKIISSVIIVAFNALHIVLQRNFFCLKWMLNMDIGTVALLVVGKSYWENNLFTLQKQLESRVEETWKYIKLLYSFEMSRLRIIDASRMLVCHFWRQGFFGHEKTGKGSFRCKLALPMWYAYVCFHNDVMGPPPPQTKRARERNGDG